MKFTIETDDENEHRRFLLGPRLAAVLWNFSEALRAKVKHGPEQTTEWSAVQDLFIDHCGDALNEAEG